MPTLIELIRERCSAHRGVVCDEEIQRLFYRDRDYIEFMIERWVPHVTLKETVTGSTISFDGVTSRSYQHLRCQNSTERYLEGKTLRFPALPCVVSKEPNGIPNLVPLEYVVISDDDVAHLKAIGIYDPKVF